MQRPYKTAEEYSKNIKILKYYLQESLKENERLALQLRKTQKEKQASKKESLSHVTAFRVDAVVKQIYKALKKKGVPLEALFRMADPAYSGQISNEAITSTLKKLDIGMADQDTMKLVLAIDSSMNGRVSEIQFQDFIHTYGVGDNALQTIKLQSLAYQKFHKHLQDRRLSASELFQQIDSDKSGVVDTEELKHYCKAQNVSMNDNEIFSVMRYMDSQKQGAIPLDKFVKSMEVIEKKDQNDVSNADFDKEIRGFKDKLIKGKINPFEIFDDADPQQMGSTSEEELQKVMKKHFPRESPFQIKKWIDLINYNHDKLIQRSQFLSIVSHFYTPSDLASLSHSSSTQLSQRLTQKSVDKLLQQFSQKIEDLQKSRREVFQLLNKNGDKQISAEEFQEGLKRQFGLESPLVINLLKVFDEDGSGSISMGEFLKVLGEDVEFSELLLMDEEISKPQKGKTKPVEKKGAQVKQVKRSLSKQSPEKKNEAKIQTKQSKVQKKESLSKDPKPQTTIERKESFIKEAKAPIAIEKKQSVMKQVKLPVVADKVESVQKEVKIPVALEKRDSVAKEIKPTTSTIEKKESVVKETKHTPVVEKKESLAKDINPPAVIEKKNSQIEATPPRAIQKTASVVRQDQSKSPNKQVEPPVIQKKDSTVKAPTQKKHNKELQEPQQPHLQTKLSKESSTSKSPPKPPKPSPQKQHPPSQQQIQENYSLEFDHDEANSPGNPSHLTEANEEEIQPFLEKVSGLYKTNKTKLLKEFSELDKRNGYLTGMDFKNVLERILGLRSHQNKDGILNSIFESAATEGTIVWYADWLEEVSTSYQPELITDQAWKEPKKQPTKPIEKKVSKVKPVEPVFDPKIQPSVGPKININDKNSKIDFQSSKSIRSNRKKSSVINEKGITNESEQVDKRGGSTQDFFLANEIIGAVVNGPQAGRSQKLLPFVQHSQSSLAEFYKLAEQAKTLKNKYKDPSFGHNVESIVKNSNNRGKYKPYLWTHVNKMWKAPLAFKGDVSPDDIRQGELGNCYFLSSLACLAEYQDLIERLFEYEDENNSLFGIWLCIDGTWTLIPLDGWVVSWQPYEGLIVPAFSQTSNKEELWVILLEKAYAKAFGSFDQISGGSPVEAIRDLTGAPGKVYRHLGGKMTQEELWQILVDADRNSFMMAAGTDPRKKGTIKEGKAEKVTDSNIVIGHAYSILSVTLLNTGDRLIQMRNPWGKTEWNGAWSDNDKRWTPQLRQLLNATAKDDGIFWMPFDAYYNSEFQATSINFIRPKYFYRSHISDSKETEFVITAPHFSHGYITISQKDKRHSTSAKPGSYAEIDFIVMAVDTKKRFRKVKEENYGLTRDACVEINLQPDETLQLFVALETSIWFNISYYGKEDVNISVGQIPNNLVEMLLSLEESDKSVETQGQPFRIDAKSFGRHFYFFVKNLDKSKTRSINIEVGGVTNIKILPPYKDSSKWTLSLKPQESKLVMYKAIEAGEFGISGYSYSA